MDTYSFMRQLADSWVLLAMTLFFLGTSSGRFARAAAEHSDTPTSVFRNETAGQTRDQNRRPANERCMTKTSTKTLASRQPATIGTASKS